MLMTTVDWRGVSGTKLSDKNPCTIDRTFCQRCADVNVCEVKQFTSIYCALKPEVREKLGFKIIDGAMT